MSVLQDDEHQHAEYYWGNYLLLCLAASPVGVGVGVGQGGSRLLLKGMLIWRLYRPA
jgi:hypothetical protein